MMPSPTADVDKAISQLNSRIEALEKLVFVLNEHINKHTKVGEYCPHTMG